MPKIYIIDKTFLKAALFFSFIMNLTFFESIVYYSYVFNPIHQYDIYFFLRYTGFTLIGWVLLFMAFTIERQVLKTTIQSIEKAVRSRGIRYFKRLLKQNFIFIMCILPVLLIGLLLFSSSDNFKSVVQSKITDLGFILLLWGIFTALSVITSRLLKSLSGSIDGLRGASDNWILSIKMSTVYSIYVVTLAWVIVRPDLVSDGDIRLHLIFSVSKDLLLLYIITELLFVSLFNLARQRCLLTVFGSKRGYIQFVAICGIIAIFAVYADFDYLVGYRILEVMPEEWKRNLTLIQIYVRDIFLLLPVIGIYLVWIFQRIAIESAKGKTAAG